MSVTLPRVLPEGQPSSTETVTYSYLEGAPMELPLTIEMGSGVVDPASVRMELGEGPIADELRTLGLPTAPEMVLWGEGLRGTFLPPRPV